MLNTVPKFAGFTLIEVMIVIAILAIAIALGVPSYREWMQNTQIRNAAESIQGGLQRARAEAVGRNVNVAFILTGEDPDWTASWAVSAVGAASAVDSSSGREGSKNVTAMGFDIDGDAATTITFSNLATVITNADASATLRGIALDVASNVLDPADSRDLVVTIGTSGVGANIRMCDPNLPASSPAACN